MLHTLSRRVKALLIRDRNHLHVYILDEYPEAPDVEDDQGKLKANIWREQVKMIEK